MARRASKPKPPAFVAGDRVLVRPTAEHPVARRGRVAKYDSVTEFVHVVVNGYTVRYRENELIRQG